MQKKEFLIFIFMISHILFAIDDPIQVGVRPFGLDIVNPVQSAASDEKAQDFQQNALPALQKLINTNLGETQALTDISSKLLDPSKLTLQTAAEARVYFVSEGAGYHNTLGVNTQGSGINEGNPQLIFPDASTPPLVAGDFVDLGLQSAGTVLDFFLIANGANGGRNTYTASADTNPDRIDHVVAFALEDSPYLLIGFEDFFGGGDRDFIEILFAVDISKQNVKKLVASPEPSLFVVLASFLLMVFYIQRQNRAL